MLVAEGYDPLREGIYEARFATSNGFLGVRGGRAVSRGSRWIEPHRTYIAGLFDIPGPRAPHTGACSRPGWLESRIIPTGGPLVHHPAEVSSHRTTLDMRRGALFTGCRLIDHPNIAVHVRTMGLVSLNERALGLHVINLEVEYGEVEVTLETSFEGLGLGLLSERIEQDLGVWRTRNSNKRLAMAAAPCLQIDGSELAPTMSGPFVWSWHWKTRTGQIVCLSRLVAVARGDSQDEAPDRVAWQKLESARQLGWRKACPRTRGRAGQSDGSAAISRSEEIRLQSWRCVSLPII